MSTFPNKIDNLPLIAATSGGVPTVVPSGLIQQMNSAIMAIEQQTGFSFVDGGNVLPEIGTVSPGAGSSLLMMNGTYTVPSELNGQNALSVPFGQIFDETIILKHSPEPTSYPPVGGNPSPLMLCLNPVYIRATRRSIPADRVTCGVFPDQHGRAQIGLVVQPVGVVSRTAVTTISSSFLITHNDLPPTYSYTSVRVNPTTHIFTSGDVIVIDDTIHRLYYTVYKVDGPTLWIALSPQPGLSQLNGLAPQPLVNTYTATPDTMGYGYTNATIQQFTISVYPVIQTIGFTTGEMFDLACLFIGGTT